MKKLILSISILFSVKVQYSQLCSGTIGTPIVVENFGTGNNFGPALPSGNTDLYYTSSYPSLAEYTLMSSTSGIPSIWHDIMQDHTPNDNNGYMLFANSFNNNSAGTVYRKAVNGLCKNSTYEFSAWIINMLTLATAGSPANYNPNITFNIMNSSNKILKSYNTGAINSTSSPQWNKYSTTFNTGITDTNIILQIYDSFGSYSGDDFAIDDLSITKLSGNSSIIESDNSIYNIYPNPVNDEMHIKRQNYTEIEVSVYSIIGNRLLSYNISANEDKIHLGQLPKGIYLLEIHQNNEKSTFKFYKN